MVEPIKLRGAALSDIVGMLRQHADDIEKMDEADRPTTLFIVEHVPADWPSIYCFGEHLGDLSNIAIMELAALWFKNNLTAR